MTEQYDPDRVQSNEYMDIKERLFNLKSRFLQLLLTEFGLEFMTACAPFMPSIFERRLSDNEIETMERAIREQEELRKQ